MPFPLLLAVPALVTGITELCVTLGGAWAASGMIADFLDGIEEWFGTDKAAELMTDQLNKKLVAAGLDLQFPTFNPLTDEGREVVRVTIEKFAVGRINAKTGAEFESLADLNQETFLVGVSQVLSKRINRETGSNLGAIWPAENFKSQLQTEVVRQFDNRGRYAGGTLFKPGTLAKIRDKIAAKHPLLMRQVKKIEADGPWGPPINEAHRKRREKGKLRQLKYRQSHQQVWAKKTWVE